MKRRCKRALGRAGKALVLYALMPLICLGCIALALVCKDMDLYSIECLAMEYSAGDLATRLAWAAREIREEKNDEGGAYFYAVKNDPSQPSMGESPLQMAPGIPEGMRPIVRKDLSGKGFINTTSYVLEENALREQAELRPVQGEEPLVLVVHTHGTEAYCGQEDFLDPEGNADGWYDPQGDSPRSEDAEQNVLAVGREFCRTLEEEGIPTLHCTVLHDKEDFNRSYSNTYTSVMQYLEQYPSIAYVVDVHRDSIVRDNGEKLKPYTVIDGKPCAQVMLVVGTDESGYSHPNWRVNMGNALLYKDTMDDLYPTLARSIYVRDVRFNQHVSTGAMLLEVGSCGNRLEEAKNAAHYSALALATLIRSAE